MENKYYLNKTGLSELLTFLSDKIKAHTKIVYKDGLEFNEDKELKVKLDSTSEKVLTSDNVQQDVLTVGESGIKVAHIQEAIEYAASKAKTTLTEIDEDKILVTKDADDPNNYTISYQDIASEESLNSEIDRATKAEKQLQDNIDTIQGEYEQHLKDAADALDLKVSWSDGNKNIIVLPNHGQLVGEPNTDELPGKAEANGNASIAMLSRWNVMDFGSVKYPINLNGSKNRPTYNDSKEIALLEDVTKLGEEVTANKLEAADNSIVLNPSESGTTIKANIDNDTLILGENGIEVSSKALNLKGSNAINVESTEEGKIVSLNIDKANTILSQSENGLLATLKFEKDTKQKHIVLKGVGGKEVTWFDYSSFVVDGMLEDASLDEEDNLVLTMNTAAGNKILKVNLAKYIDLYNAGNGIDISEDRTISVKIKQDDKYLDITENGIASKGIDEAIENLNDVFLTQKDAEEQYVKVSDIYDLIEGIVDDKIKALRQEMIQLLSWKEDTELLDKLDDGGEFILSANTVKQSDCITLTNDSTIDLNGYSIGTENGGQYGDCVVISGTNVVLKNGIVTPAKNASLENASTSILVKSAEESHVTLEDVKVTGVYPVYLNSANENSTITINGGEYYPEYELNPAVYVACPSSKDIGGKIIINNGTFGQEGKTYPYLLNVLDKLRKVEGKEPRDFIEVRGGQYINFNPADCISEGEHTNFVADGYTVKKIYKGNNIIYKVCQ